jgi:hypothetical protein
LSRAARAALLAACALIVLLLALAPAPADAPLGRLANVEGEGPDPRFDTPLDGGAIRRAGERVPDDETYAVFARDADPLLQGNLKAAAQLFLAPSLPVQDLTRAQWILVYRRRDPGSSAFELGGNLWLIHADNPHP